MSEGPRTDAEVHRDADGWPVDQFATGSGPLSETTLSCPWCDFEATERDYDTAQRRRFDHVRETHPEGTNADVADQLKQHDAEVRDGGD